MNEKRQIRDLLGMDLTGYKLAECHYLELRHGLMPFFPAIYNDDTRAMVLAHDIEVIQEVEKLLEDRPHKLGRILCLISTAEENPHAFSLAAREIIEGERLRLLTRESFNRLVNDDLVIQPPFRWAPGLIG